MALSGPVTAGSFARLHDPITHEHLADHRHANLVVQNQGDSTRLVRRFALRCLVLPAYCRELELFGRRPQRLSPEVFTKGMALQNVCGRVGDDDGSRRGPDSLELQRGQGALTTFTSPDTRFTRRRPKATEPSSGSR